jgi:fidgetin-like protein 1
MNEIVLLTENYSASDLTMLCKDSSFGPIRTLVARGLSIADVPLSSIPPISIRDFMDSLQQIRPSVSVASLEQFVTWNATYGVQSNAK